MAWERFRKRFSRDSGTLTLVRPQTLVFILLSLPEGIVILGEFSGCDFSKSTSPIFMK